MTKPLNSEKYQAVIKLLRDLREELEVSQITLSERLSVTQSFVSKCERSGRRLDALEFIQWLNALGVSMAEFEARLNRTAPQMHIKTTEAVNEEVR